MLSVSYIYNLKNCLIGMWAFQSAGTIEYGPKGSLHYNAQLGYDHFIKIPLRIKTIP